MPEPRRPLVIVGAGGHAREVHQLVLEIDAVHATWNVLGFAVETPYLDGAPVHGLAVFDIATLASTHADAHVIVAVGEPALRRRLVTAIAARPGHRFATLVHPQAIVGARVVMGEGCVVFAGCVLTTDIRLGRHVHLNAAVTVSHDSCIDDHATLGPRACCCGGVHIGEAADIGASAVLLPRVEVGARSIVGAGAVVTQNIPADVTAVGAPARIVA